MRIRLALCLLTVGAAPNDRPETYLMSIVDVPLKPGHRIERFSFATWGVDVEAVCRTPFGWRITAGSGAAPAGEISGRGTVGATWFSEGSPNPLRNFVLVTLHGSVQQGQLGPVPATFSGTALISHMDDRHKVRLTYKNIRLVRARRCP